MDNAIKTDAIEKYLLDNNLSKSEFCKRCHISTDTYDEILKRKTDFNIIALFKIAREINSYISRMYVK